MTAGGINNGDNISGLGFSYETAQNIPTSGNIKIYLENTTAVTNTKSTTWATVIAPMTLASDAATTIPAAVGDYNIEFSNGAPFTYTGGSLFVAFDYQNLSNPVATTPNVSFCDNTPVGGAPGVLSVRSDPGSTTLPTTLAPSNFRPQVRLGVPVACARPTNLGFANQTATSVNLTWNPNGGTGIELQFGPQGFDQRNAGQLISSPNVISPYTLTGLTPNTVYDYYVRTVCAGTVSNWNGPFTFTTLFLPSDLPYNTSFENDEFNYFGWIAQRDPSGTVGNFWQVVEYPVGDPFVQQGVYSARVGVGVTVAQANDWIISRGINLAANQNVDISFYTRALQTGSTTPAKFNLTVGTTQDATAQSIIATSPDFTNTTYLINNYSYTAPAAGVYYFGIQNAIATNTAGTVFFAVDNFTAAAGTASVNDVNANDFTVYPNPASSIIAINSNLHTINKVAVVDLNGRTVMNVNFENVLDASLDISNLSSGMYLIDIITDAGTVTKKIMKN
jgi:hypothetical protein